MQASNSSAARQLCRVSNNSGSWNQTALIPTTSWPIENSDSAITVPASSGCGFILRTSQAR